MSNDKDSFKEPEQAAIGICLVGENRAYIANELLIWNRSQGYPKIKVGYEYGVADALISIIGDLTTAGKPLNDLVINNPCGDEKSMQAVTLDDDVNPEFEEWWDKHGQFMRAGGGQYEKTFAYEAWVAASKHANEKTQARQASERQEVLLKLREICGVFGDNDWSDDLHFADVLEKHLYRHLDSPGLLS